MATMTSTFSAANSAAFADNCAGSPLAKRSSIETVLPSIQPRELIPSRNSPAANLPSSAAGQESNPTRGTPETGCAATSRGVAPATKITAMRAAGHLFTARSCCCAVPHFDLDLHTRVDEAADECGRGRADRPERLAQY